MNNLGAGHSTWMPQQWVQHESRFGQLECSDDNPIHRQDFTGNDTAKFTEPAHAPFRLFTIRIKEGSRMLSPTDIHFDNIFSMGDIAAESEMIFRRAMA